MRAEKRRLPLASIGWPMATRGKSLLSDRVSARCESISVQGTHVYFVRRGEKVVLLLCGGDKSTQARDIEFAHELARSFKG